ncbi:unnamed protein product [Arctia plantaginis]|uniref:RNA-directed DNA polymerase n=1 Tax=Arctia plantaginis TaxID=874455 RepID=A0A8S0ZL05_ARCPL|nr:unnamed protein product [Arctia plantaginis]
MAHLRKCIKYLKKDELINELSAMGISANPDDTVVGLRSELRTALRLIRRGSIKAITAVPAVAASELSVCEPKISELEQVLSSGDFVSNKNCRTRVALRANYLLARLARCGLDCPELVGIRDRLVKVLAVSESDTDSDSEVSEKDTDPTHRDHIGYTSPVVRADRSTRPNASSSDPNSNIIVRDRPVNLNSFNIKYDGSSCVRVFIERLEELRCAREVTKDKILTAFSDLLDGPALSWYRTNKESFTSYEGMIEELKETFDLPDYDYRLRNEIRQRTQARSETLGNYISTMQAMFSRLSCKMPSEEQLDILMHNIRPDYMKELALHDVKSIVDLKRLGKRLELARARAEAFREPAFERCGITSDLHHMKNKYVQKTSQQVSAVARSSTSSAHKCFRCGGGGHPTSGCTQSRDVVCFRCGHKGVRAPECPKCNAKPKNEVLFTKRDNDIRPYLVVKILNLNVLGLLDSGAACSVLEITTAMIFGVDFWQQFQLGNRLISQNINLSNFSDCNPVEALSLNSGLEDYNNLTADQKRVINCIIEKFDTINTDKVGLGRTSLVHHVIDTGDSKPIKQRYYPLSPLKQKALEEELDRMLEMGVVTPSQSAWNSPVVMVEKANGDLRLCLDSRKLNSVSKSDAYPLPYINQILDHLNNARYLTSIDLSAAYWQIPFDSPQSAEKTAFTVPRRGLFQYNVMCFGLIGASASMQRLMDRLFGPEFDNRVFAFQDDIIIVASTFEEHVDLLHRVYQRLKDAGLTINMQKSHFCRSELKYLGYYVDKHGLRTDPGKVDVILNYPTPSNAKEVKRFLGMAGWYRRFVNNFSKISKPLCKLTSKNVSFEWTREAEESFNLLKAALVSAPILKMPDYSLPFRILSDASSFSVAAVLTQTHEGVEHPIAYCSRSLNKNEVNYSTTERELLAIDTIGTSVTRDSWYLHTLDRVKKNPQHFPNFDIRNNCLYRLSKQKYSLTSDFEWKLVVPLEDRLSLLTKYHDDVMSAHGGVWKTHKRLALYYYWPKMYESVKEYVDKCETCKQYKPVNTTRPGLMGNPKRVSRPFEAISCDLLGPFPTSSKGNVHLIVVSDYFSKYVMLCPIRIATGVAVARFIEKNVFLVHGVCKTIYMDNGPQFVSKPFRDLLVKYNVPNIYYNPRYHAQTNQAERAIRNVVQGISCYVKSHHKKWDENLVELQCALNTAVSEATRFSPYFLVHGREFIGDGVLYRQTEIPAHPNSVSIDSPVSFGERLKELHRIYDQVRNYLDIAHRRNEKYYNLRKRHVELKVGQIVYKRTFYLSNKAKNFTAKLAPKFMKCIVTARRSPLVYELSDLDGKDLGVYHIKDILKYSEKEQPSDPSPTYVSSVSTRM